MTDLNPSTDPSRQVSHAWLAERIEAYLAGGLSESERQTLENHAANCPECAAALSAARQADEKLRSFFAASHPQPGLEDRLIRGLRQTEGHPRMRLAAGAHPALRRAAIGIAATVALGAMGYLGSKMLQRQSFGFPQFALGGESDDASISAVEPGQHRADSLRFFAPTDRKSTDADYLALEDGRDGYGFKRLGGQEQADQQAENLVLGLNGGLVPTVPSATVSVRYDDHGWTSQQSGTFRPLRTMVTANSPTSAVKPPNGLSTNDAWPRLSIAPDAPLIANNDEIPFTAPDTDGDGIADAGLYKLRDSSIDRKAYGIPRANNAASTDAFTQNPSTGVPGSLTDGIQYYGGLKVDHGWESDGEIDVMDGPTNASVRWYGMPKVTDTAAANNAFKPSDIIPGSLASKVAAALTGRVEPNGVRDLKFRPEFGDKWGAHAKTPAAEQNWALYGQLALATNQPVADVSGATNAKTGPTVPSVAAPPTTSAVDRKIIRNGQMDFQVDNFDSAFARVGALAGEEGGYVSSTESQRLPNGKMKGLVTLRVPPDHLDRLILKLRGIGELLTQQISAEDITKQYTDLASELTAAQAMQERLLTLIKSGKGEVKDLVEAEKELGVWREKIEHVEGEIRYDNSLIAMSTLQVGLTEKDIHAAVVAVETENVDAGIEVDDVESARQQVMKEIDAAKGSVLESDMKKFDAGQYAATITADLPVDAAGPLIDRLRQIGRVARLDITSRQIAQTEPSGQSPQNADPANGAAPRPLKVERQLRRFNISLYNLANVEPRETAEIDVACADVQAAYQAIVNALHSNKPGAPGASLARLVSSSMESQAAAQSSCLLKLQTAAGQAADLENVIRSAGQVLRYTVTQNPDTNNTTAAKRGFVVKLVTEASVAPRETRQLSLVADRVADAYHALLDAVRQAGGRVLASNLCQQADGVASAADSSSASLSFEIPREKLAVLEAQLDGVASAKGTAHPFGQVLARKIVSAPVTAEAIDSKVRIDALWHDAGALPPLEIHAIAVEVSAVPAAAASLTSAAQALGGRVLDQQLASRSGGRAGGVLSIDVPASSAGGFLAQIKQQGVIRSDSSQRAADALQLAQISGLQARFDITLGNPAELGPQENVGPTFMQALHTSRVGLVLSIGWLVIALCLVSPWALLLWGIWRLFRRNRRKAKAAVPA